MLLIKKKILEKSQAGLNQFNKKITVMLNLKI